MENKELKTLDIKVTLKGQGIVNYDGEVNLYDLHSKGFYKELEAKNSNYKIGKFNIFCDEEGNYHKELKISSNCMKLHLLGESHINDVVHFQYPQIAGQLLSNPFYYMRGYMHTTKGDSGIKKSTCLTVLDAISKNACTKMDIFTRSGSKDSVQEDKKSTSLYNKETTGENEYTCKMIFDVKQAQFSSIDNIFDRQAIPTEVWEGGYLAQGYEKNYGRIPYTQGVYKSTECYTGENGLLFDDEYINYLIKELLHKIFKLEIKRGDAVVRTEKVEIAPVFDDELPKEVDYFEIKKEDIDTLPNYKMKQFYSEGKRTIKLDIKSNKSNNGTSKNNKDE